MKNLNRFRVLSVFFILAACSGMSAQTTLSAKGPKVEPDVVAFTGTVEAMNGAEWTISGQKITLGPQALPDLRIAVGDKVKVEATVSADDVVATKVELSGTKITILDVLSDVLSTPYPIATVPPSLDVTGKESADNAQELSAQAAGVKDGPNHEANANKPAGNGNSSDDGSNHNSNDNHGQGGNSSSGG